MAHVHRTRCVNSVTSTHVAPELHLADNIFTVLNETFPALEDGAAWVLLGYVMARQDIRFRIAMNHHFDARVGTRQLARTQPEPAPHASVPRLPTCRAQPTGKQSHEALPSRYWQRGRNSNAVRGDFQPLGVLFSRPTAQHLQRRHCQHQPMPCDPFRLRAPRFLPLPTHTFQRPEAQFNPHP